MIQEVRCIHCGAPSSDYKKAPVPGKGAEHVGHCSSCNTYGIMHVVDLKKESLLRLRDTVREAYRAIEHHIEVFGFGDDLPHFHEDMRIYLNKIIRKINESKDL